MGRYLSAVGTVGVTWVTVMEMLNLNSMIYQSLKNNSDLRRLVESLISI